MCLGNICRSPTAAAIMRSLVSDGGLEARIEIDSAGTGGWHTGEPPDPRAVDAAARRGIALSGTARQVGFEDFESFDLIIAMDGSNELSLRRVAPDERAREKVRLLREFDPASDTLDDLDVPDPYYGGPTGFDDMYELISAACKGLLEQIRAAEHT